MQYNSTIFESLFNRKFSDADAIDYLKEITEVHPYFSPAQFFLLQKTKADSNEFENRVAQTNILFNNPHWLNFQLQQTGEQVQEVPTVTEVQEVENVQVEEITEIIVPHVADATSEEQVYEADNTEATEPVETEIEPMKIELKMPEIKTSPDETLLFEPMHMVDYFASQGIKLSDEVQMADKLGKQLKSFTEWLKTMKKVHVEKEAKTDDKTDNAIQSLAENSNAEAEVLTESMAEVFAKQGKMGKAREVYQKLSLLNPAKSTYFAAKIENLKGI